ncbi:MAG: hypothetical protein K5885_02490 [Bacteroidales bacterium]|nr:hypothetical protein [Bacteroidales bacterium]
MEDEIKPGMTFLYVTTMEGKTFKLDAKSEPVEWPSANEQKSDAKVETKTYSATLTFKLGKRMREKMRWALNGCKTRKEYRKFKKLRKRVLKDIKIINKIKDFNNPKEVRSLERLSKVLKNTKILTINV